MSKFAAIQMASGPNVNANLSEAYRLIKNAVAEKAELVVLPENFAHMGMDDKDVLKIAESPEEPGQIQTFLSNTAKKYGIWLLGGTVPIKSDENDKIYSASILYNDSGNVVCQYDKIHLFDVDLSEENGSYRESAFIKAGSEIVITDSPFGKLGIGVCYDIRFPELFRRMTKLGMEVLLLPSAFTASTGKAHWEILNRSRAIENLSYVVSSAQGGYHVNGRETHGDSMIVSPWGDILDRLTRGSGVVMADIDLKLQKETRANFPVLQHRKIVCNFVGVE